MPDSRPRVLYINSPETDYGQDLLYSGLVKVLGADRVYDYPYNKRFHFIDKKYPRNLGYSPGLSAVTRLFQPLDIKSIDLVVVGSCKELCIESYMRLLPDVASSTPVVFVDGGDWADLGGDLRREKSKVLLADVERVRPFDRIFKREYLVTEEFPEKVVPFPFAMNMSRVPVMESVPKKYDVSFWAVESDPVRTRALALIEGLFDCRANGTTRSQKFHQYKRKAEFYLRELAACKIVLNFRGAGWDTLRYWEVPAVGSFMISQKPGIRIPNNFEHGKNIIFCKDDLSDLVDLCVHFLKHESEREKIADAGRKHLLEFHTDIARAEYLLNQVGMTSWVQSPRSS